MAASDELPRLIERRNAAKYLLKGFGIIGWLLVVTCGVLLLFGSGLDLWAVTGLIFGAALIVPGLIAKVRDSRFTGPWRTRTPSSFPHHGGWSTVATGD